MRYSEEMAEQSHALLEKNGGTFVNTKEEMREEIYTSQVDIAVPEATPKDRWNAVFLIFLLNG